MEQRYALDSHINIIADELALKNGQIRRSAELFAEAATVPFISRYRKEATGGLDEVQLQKIKDRLDDLENLEKRRSTILRTIEEQGGLSEELREKINASFDSRELEDLYLPYKPKRRTRATKAKELGLEGLAQILWRQDTGSPRKAAGEFLTDEVTDVDQALAGAKDIMAEWISEDAEARAELRTYFGKRAKIFSKVVKKKKDQAGKYRDYFEWQEDFQKCPAHRFLALQRGAAEGFLRIKIEPDEERALALLNRRFVKRSDGAGAEVQLAAADAYKRLIAPSLENEFGSRAKEAADEESIQVFAENLEQLLLSPPLGPKRVMAIDPGFRTGCKVVCLNEQGDLLEHGVIFPHEPQKKSAEAVQKLQRLAEQYRIEAVAIGNGTAGRETETLAREIDFGRSVGVFMVNEDGASVYSASETAREEFPNEDVTVRGAVSIGRRLMDPLSELVKIDPKSIGVGQYQHDVDQKKLRKSLDVVVESCVNRVGVNVNVAGAALLGYVSGMGAVLAKKMVAHRSQNGPFQSREQLHAVPGMGPKVFQQAAGFLRIPDAWNPLDASAVHPESYHVVEKMAGDLGCSVKELMESSDLRASLDIKKYVGGDIGLPTLRDIMEELEKPGRDPRPSIEEFRFDDSVHSIEDLNPGMVLPGIVTNITRFGAFVDIGVKQDGLLHISEMADRFVKDPADVVKLQQKLRVKVTEVDTDRKRIGLSLKQV